MSERNTDKDSRTGRIILSEITLLNAGRYIHNTTPQHTHLHTRACTRTHTHANTNTYTNTQRDVHRNTVALPGCLVQSIGNQLGGYVTVVIPFYPPLALLWELERCCQISQ